MEYLGIAVAVVFLGFVVYKVTHKRKGTYRPGEPPAKPKPPGDINDKR